MSYPGQGQWGPPQNGGQWGPPPDQQQGQWQQPGPPQQGGWPQQGPPQNYQQGPPQQGGWGPPPGQGQWGQQQEEQQQQAAPVVKGSLGAFYSQPTVGGGPGVKFAQVGTEHYMIVSRTVTGQDVEQQTGMGKDSNKLQYHNDGSPKWVMKIPVNVRQGPDSPDGKARWYCYGAARDLLNAKIQQSGAPVVTEMTPEGPVQAYIPEPGSLVRVKKAGTRKIPGGLNDANVWEVDYWRPDEAVKGAAAMGIEYPTVAELSQVTAQAPAEGPTPTATPPAGNGQVMGQPGPQPGAAPGPAQGWQQPANQFPNPAVATSPQGWQQQPAGPPPDQGGWQQPAAAAGGWQQGPPNGAQQPAGPPQGAPVGAPPPMDWQGQQPQQPAAGGYIPQATNQPQQGPPPGIAPDTQQLQQSLTGRPG